MASRALLLLTFEFHLFFLYLLAMRMNEIQLSQRLDQARAFINDGKHLHAEQIYHRLINDQPMVVHAYTELATLYADNDNVQAGIKILSRAHQQFPENVEITFMLGTFHLRTEEYSKALTSYQKLVNKKLPHVYFTMGVAYLYKNNIKPAEEQFRLTLKLDPHFPKGYESLGELLIKRKAYAEAISYLKRAVTLDTYNWVSHHLLGVAYQAIADLKNSYNEFVLAIEMDPKEAHSWQKCGEVLLEMKRYKEAEQYLRKALELNPHFADALANFGHLYLMKGDTARSAEFFNKALNVDPHNSRARFGKVQTKILQKK